jgi:metallophosphoesterase (TIGR00282 family)
VRILFIGDVVGQAGRRVLRSGLKRLRRELEPDFVVANGENSAGGIGLTPATVDDMLDAGCDVITGGNHTWSHSAVFPYLDSQPRVLRPANHADGKPGRGFGQYDAADGTQVAIVNLQGRVFMEPIDDPFRAADHILQEVEDIRVVVVDFHAEATSEKIALGKYLDGRVTAVLGTHTHVATADARVLPKGTAYVTDVGMTGPHDSVIGVRTEDVLRRFLGERPAKFRTATGDPKLSAVLVEADASRGRALSIRRVEYPEPTEES